MHTSICNAESASDPVYRRWHVSTVGNVNRLTGKSQHIPVSRWFSKLEGTINGRQDNISITVQGCCVSAHAASYMEAALHIECSFGMCTLVQLHGSIKCSLLKKLAVQGSWCACGCF